MWFIQLILVSLISFIHFQLDHSLSIIENWIFDQGWEILTVTKIISTYIIFKFIIIRTDSRKPMHDLLIRGNARLSKSILIISAYALFYLMTFGRPVKSDQVSIEILKILSSYFGIIIYFMCDIIILNLIEILYPSSEKYRKYKIILLPILNHIFIVWSVPYARNISYQIYFIFFILIYLSQLKKLNWTYPLLYLAVVIAPIFSVMGLDFIWGSSYSFFVMRGELQFFHYLILTITTILFIRYKKAEL
jgi:hypothetical protein